MQCNVVMTCSFDLVGNTVMLNGWFFENGGCFCGITRVPGTELVCYKTLGGRFYEWRQYRGTEKYILVMDGDIENILKTVDCIVDVMQHCLKKRL